ncbi:HPP family protein [Paenibacillus methanolicus]|uniref:HPP family protein n=1 Tax=Paenibacillus methanolicus TaxID=582686 RepID=A0A5S5BQC2_9BACL|nr:HPP family protein [Paenibacillus methanolicus]TYP69395.1 HPP family protein [Paenibacillus methanolicus]
MSRVIAMLGKMKGGAPNPSVVRPRAALAGAIGGFAAIGLLALLTEWSAASWIMAPFGASCVLAFGLWESPLAQPRNIIGGHLLSTFVGLLVYHLIGGGALSLAIGVGLAIGLMMVTRTTHPPAGADPIVVILAGSGWSFLLTPVLAGSVVIVAAALLLNNLDPNRRYPVFWK